MEDFSPCWPAGALAGAWGEVDSSPLCFREVADGLSSERVWRPVPDSQAFRALPLFVPEAR